MAEKIYMRYMNGSLIPADNYAARRLEEKKLKHGEIVGAVFTKLRTVGSNRNAHAIADLMIHNHDDFIGMSAHTALKTLQILSGAACDVFGRGDKVIKVPKSFNFTDMDQFEFDEAMKIICRYISEHYFLDMTAEEVFSLSERFANE